MDRTVIFVIVISFLTTLVITPWAIRFFSRIGLSAPDIHRQGNPYVARAGIAAVSGIFMAIMGIILAQTFGVNQELHGPLFAAVLTLLLITFAGFLDDLPLIKDKTAYKKDESPFRFKQWQKPLLIIPALIPLMVVSAGNSTMNLPILGTINLGLLYPLLVVPIIIFGAANMVNFLEGLNGLGSGMGLIYMGMLGIYAWYNNIYLGAVIAFSTFGSLLAFWKYHQFPGRTHAGDALTYMLGAALACVAILGNMEKAALIVSIPFFIELALKLRGKLKKDTLGYIDANGKIRSRYKKIYSIPHIWMRTGKYTERQIVYFVMLVELIFASLIWVV